ncbi:MAG: DNA translocase FtsK 4TM domain-containing protein [Eggerthellaceae bacterium]|nr:DNA translocase FtsK 4TM domain-containing protein [Eggerthellaceae bacterium]
MSRKTASSSVPTRRSNSKSSSSRGTHVSSSEPVLGDTTKRDIAGVVFIVLGIILFIAALMPTDAVVTSFISSAMYFLFGVGCFIVPVFFIAIGITFLIRFEKAVVPVRVAIGLAIILIAILGLIALTSPIASADYGMLFNADIMSTHGGCAGAFLAWAGNILFGPVITAVILVALILIGVLIIGFSISRLIEKTRTKHFRHGQAEGNVDLNARHSGRFGLFGRKKDDEPELASATDATIKYQGARNDASPFATDDMWADEGSGDYTVPLGDSSSEPTAVIDERENLMNLGSSAPTRVLGKKRASSDSETVQAQQPAKRNTPKKAKKPISAAASATAATMATAATGATAATPVIEAREENDGEENPKYILPSWDLLECGDGTNSNASQAELQETAQLLQDTLRDFKVDAKVVGWVAGPTVTLFKISLPPGVRVNKIMGLGDDIALALKALGVRIFSPIPGTNYVGIEVPNKQRQTVYLPDVMRDVGEGPLQIAIGKDVEGNSVTSDLAKMPHLRIAGTNGSGKSVAINAMIMSILMRATPDEVRFIMIDPKRVEFEPYNGIPHLYVPVVTECKEASSALAWAVAEMEKRLKIFAKTGAKNILSYNEKAKQKAREREEEKLSQSEEADSENIDATIPIDPFQAKSQKLPNAIEDAEEQMEPMPYIVIVIDELADLMMNVGKEVENSISRIAQLARAAGIHLIIATQRPSTNVVTGLIKANITCRIGLTVASGIDSRVILDTTGAEDLIGYGDLLISKPEYPKPVRVQGPFVSDEEIASVVEHWKSQGEPEYHSEILQTNLITLGDSSPEPTGGSGDLDPLLWEAADIVVSCNIGSTSNLQRRLRVGYTRAGRIMDQLQEEGIVGPQENNKPREILVDEEELETLKAFAMSDM